jgi:hypothetical protein
MAWFMRDKSHNGELHRQQVEQSRLEAAMNRQETQTQRDEQLKTGQEWLKKQLHT